MLDIPEELKHQEAVFSPLHRLFNLKVGEGLVLLLLDFGDEVEVVCCSE